MGELQKDINKKYGIDISKINLVKLYGISNSELSDDELNRLISERKQKWERSVNGSNERLAARDRKYLENAETYEKILRDQKLLKQLFDYYN